MVEQSATREVSPYGPPPRGRRPTHQCARSRTTGPVAVTSATPGSAANGAGSTGSVNSRVIGRHARWRRSSIRSTATMRPSAMIPTRSQKCHTSSSRCDERNTVAPPAVASRTSSANTSWAIGSSQAVGSSSSRTAGRWARAWTRATFWRFPDERSRIGRSRSTSSRSASASIRAGSGSPRSPASHVQHRRPVRRSESAGFPATYPMWRCTATASRWASRPRMRAWPRVGRIRSRSSRMTVVLPAPFGPRNPKISPVRTSRSTSSTPRVRP